jgi:putative transposase
LVCEKRNRYPAWKALCFPDACSPGLCPKYRRQIFDHDATEKLRTYYSNVCADFEAELVEMDGEPDHVHLLINYPPKLAISSLVNSLKGVSGR